ncbi:hypothetical protein HYPSUDRAFT_44680 [Hypholoma sublateritium FD-334 SS-4]|uniref:Uncharacterized protein n=1 Tax=Hypholoma sublateritium (strain FD-334 SS-4) TaxID=945553 RepID=A0A0D2KWJ7_HYPSF|nr:hypothetical protein HYPSUDRAFT_44680 [Hypholoma sublateritium FD-334 SS-4]
MPPATPSARRDPVREAAAPPTARAGILLRMDAGSARHTESVPALSLTVSTTGAIPPRRSLV